MSAREDVERLLTEHGPAGTINSREGWTECVCGAHLQVPGGFDVDGYALKWDAEDRLWATHRTQVLDEAGLLAEPLVAADWDALAEQASRERGHDLPREIRAARARELGKDAPQKPAAAPRTPEQAPEAESPTRDAETATGAES